MARSGMNRGGAGWPLPEAETLVRWLHDREEQHRRERVRQRINQVWDIVARERDATSKART